MSYAFAFIEAIFLMTLGFVAALTTLVVALLRRFSGSAWRQFLGGSIGCFVGNLVIVVILSQRFGIGIAGGPPPPNTLNYGVLYGPFLVSAVGIALGSWFGGRLARRRNVRPSV